MPKKYSEKIRVIHHLSFPFHGDSVNASIREEYLPLQGFASAADAVRALGPGCQLIKLDVIAAYKQVAVRREDWHLLGFMWKGKFYYERVLPFGLKSSCRLWDLYAEALHQFIKRVCGIEVVIHYIDDFLFVIRTKSDADAALLAALNLCEDLGVPMARIRPRDQRLASHSSASSSTPSRCALHSRRPSWRNCCRSLRIGERSPIVVCATSSR